MSRNSANVDIEQRVDQKLERKLTTRGGHPAARSSIISMSRQGQYLQPGRQFKVNKDKGVRNGISFPAHLASQMRTCLLKTGPLCGVPRGLFGVMDQTHRPTLRVSITKCDSLPFLYESIAAIFYTLKKPIPLRHLIYLPISTPPTAPNAFLSCEVVRHCCSRQQIREQSNLHHRRWRTGRR